MDNIKEIKEILEILSLISTAFGVPIAILLFWNEKTKERFDREWGTYNALDEKYIKYLELCIINPRYNLYNTELMSPPELSNMEEIQRSALFEILIAILERSDLMYHEHSDGPRRSQWEGWLAYIEGWTQDRRFRPMWNLISSQYDSGFVKFVETKLDEAKTHKPR